MKMNKNLSDAIRNLRRARFSLTKAKASNIIDDELFKPLTMQINSIINKIKEVDNIEQEESHTTD
jgi:hypothetical protein